MKTTFNSANQNVKNLFAKTLTSVTLLDSMKLFFATNRDTFKITRKTGAKNLYDRIFVHIMKGKRSSFLPARFTCCVCFLNPYL